MSNIIYGKSDRLAELLKERDRLTRRLEEISEEIKSMFGDMIKQGNGIYIDTDMMGGDDHE